MKSKLPIMRPELLKKYRALKADEIRMDGRLERHCDAHGVGHPVGHVNHNMIHDWSMWVHGCCTNQVTGKSCCADWEREK